MNHEALLYFITVSIIERYRDELDIKLSNKLVGNQHKLGLTFSILLSFGTEYSTVDRINNTNAFNLDLKVASWSMSRILRKFLPTEFVSLSNRILINRVLFEL